MHLLAIGVIAITGLLAAASPLPASATSGHCSPRQQALGTCGATNTGTEIIVDGSQTEHGSPGSGQGIHHDSPGSGGPKGPPAPPPPDPFQECLDDWDSYIRCFHGPEDDDDPEDDGSPSSPGLPAVTITDLARFAPSPTVLSGEPDGVGVVGLPTNFVAAASVQTVEGTLLGYPVSVRFTPTAYDFDYGDGETASATEPGASWDALDLPQFSPTPTSHTYDRRGVYRAHVDVRYAAAVDLGIGWFPVAGELTAPGADIEIRIFEAHTALVAHTCAQAPASPGC